MAALGDLDGDGTGDLAVGANGTGLLSQGAVWILFLNPDGTVASEAKILGFRGYGGSSLATLGDLDGDGTGELAVGAPGDDDGDGDQIGRAHV